MTLPLIIACGVLLLAIAALFFIALCRVGAMADEVTQDALRDGRGDDGFDWSWPPSTTDCTGGGVDASPLAASSPVHKPTAVHALDAEIEEMQAFDARQRRAMNADHKLPAAEARGEERGQKMPHPPLERREGKASPSQPRDSRPARYGQPADLSVWRGERNPDPDEAF